MGGERELFQIILTPVDFSPCSNEAFRVAADLARVYGAQLLVLHVIDTGVLAALHRLGCLPSLPMRRPSAGGCGIMRG